MSFELARQEIERHVKVYKAFEEAQNALIALASLEQHTKELGASKAVLEASIQSLKEEEKKKKERLISLKTQIEDTEVTVAETLKEAEAQKLLELESKYKEIKDIKDKEIAGLEDVCTGLKVKVKNYNMSLDSKQQEVDVLEKRILSAKEQIQKMLNG